MLKKGTLVKAALAISLLLGIHGPPDASAALKDLGPVNQSTGFPMWYRDASTTTFAGGLPLELCLSQAPSQLAPGNPMCVLLAGPPPDTFNPLNPIVFPTNFPGEGFYFIADADFTAADPGATLKMVYRAAVEGAFLSANALPLNGTQVAFMRVRFRMDAPVAGTYTITHPYGVITQNVTTPGAKSINFTEDIPVGPAPGFFDAALNKVPLPGTTTDVAPFLQWTAPLPPPDPTTGEQFIGDPNVSHAVTGSPFNTNFVTVVGPPGSGINLTTSLFQVAGKKAMFGTIAPQGVANFGSLQAGSVSAPTTVKVTSTTQQAGQLFTVNGITFTGDAASFATRTSAVNPCPATFPFSLGPNQSCNVDVVFSPTAPAGLKTGIMTFNTTDPAGEAKTTTFTGTAITVTAALTSSVPSPQQAGAAITFTGTATGGAGPFQYRFWLKAGGVWTIVQNYSTKNTWAWNTKGLPAGLYSVQVDARTVGSTAVREATANVLYRLDAPAAATGVTLAPAAATPSPQPSGTLVTFNAQGTGGSGAYEYRFWLKTAAGWTEMQPYGPAASWAWDTGGVLPGTYSVQVDVRSAGTTVRSNASRAINYTLSTPATVSAGLMSNVKSPAAVGTPITFTATAVGGTAPYTYRFWLRTGTTWAQVQAYSATPTWTWTPTAPGSYAIQLDVKTSGSTAARDAAKVVGFTIQ